jgi:hypothetical protein
MTKEDKAIVKRVLLQLLMCGEKFSVADWHRITRSLPNHINEYTVTHFITRRTPRDAIITTPAHRVNAYGMRFLKGDIS